MIQVAPYNSSVAFKQLECPARNLVIELVHSIVDSLRLNESRCENCRTRLSSYTPSARLRYWSFGHVVLLLVASSGFFWLLLASSGFFWARSRFEGSVPFLSRTT